jgi:hypothetical protein
MKRLTLTDRVENIELHLAWVFFSLIGQWDVHFHYDDGAFFPLSVNGTLFHLPWRRFFSLNGQWTLFHLSIGAFILSFVNKTIAYVFYMS